jgi:integrase
MMGRRGATTLRIPFCPAERARIVSETAQGVYVEPNRDRTVRAYFVNEWLPTKAGKKPSTQRCYRDELVQFLDAYGHFPLQAVDAPHLEKLKRDMLSGKLRRVGKAGEPLSPRSVNLMLTVAGMALEVAVKRGLIARNAADIVDRVESDPDAGADRGEWQAADAVRFLRSVTGERLYAAYILSLLGLRRGEVTGLRWPDIDLTGEQAEVRGSNPRARRASRSSTTASRLPARSTSTRRTAKVAAGRHICRRRSCW